MLSRRHSRSAGLVTAGLALFAANAEAQSCSRPCDSAKTLTVSLTDDDDASKDLVSTAVAAGSFQTLAAALQAAELVGALQGEGPFTVFAPTDEAFAKLGKGTLRKLLRPENRDRLTQILLYHVVAGRQDAATVSQARALPSLGGQRIPLSRANGLMVAGAALVDTDIDCSNGIIHVVDSVLIPSEDNLVEVAQNAGTFKTLLAAAKAAGLVDALVEGNNLTVFAPSDEAFAKIDPHALQDLLKPENKQTLARILKYHVVPARVYSDAALAAGSASTLAGPNVNIRLAGGRLTVNDSAVIANDIDASNGVIHVIDTVLMPPQPEGDLTVGFETDFVGDQLARYLGLNGRALTVLRAEEGCPMQVGDVIIEINGTPYRNSLLTESRKAAGFGGQIEFTVLRRGQEPQSITCTVSVK